MCRDMGSAGKRGPSFDKVLLSLSSKEIILEIISNVSTMLMQSAAMPEERPSCRSWYITVAEEHYGQQTYKALLSL